MKYKLSEKLNKIICARFHKNKSCSEIGTERGVSRQAISAYINIYLDKLKSGSIVMPDKCEYCRSGFVTKEMLKKRKKYVWKKYSVTEIKLIENAKSINELLAIARKVGRTSKAIVQKSRRLH